MEAQIRNCLQQKEFKQYSARIGKNDVVYDHTLTEDFYKDSMNIHFTFSLVSNRRNVYEEVLILDEIGLVGSLGGSLGLFVGFSFFGYVTPLLEVLFDGVADYF